MTLHGSIAYYQLVRYLWVCHALRHEYGNFAFALGQHVTTGRRLLRRLWSRCGDAPRQRDRLLGCQGFALG